MLREMETTYGRSPGGYIWAIIQPVGMIALLSLAFSLLVRAPSMGTSFMFFYATGFLPFDLYGQVAGKITAALKYSRPLLSYPSVTWVDAIAARFLLNMITGVTLFCIVITGIMLFVETRTIVNIVPVTEALLMAGAIGLGIGLTNCLLIGLYPVWGLIWGILSRPLFLASGVLFIYEDMPRAVQNILWWNPLMHVTGLLRSGFYPTYQASYVSLTYGFGFALILIAVSLIFLRANYKLVLEQR